MLQGGLVRSRAPWGDLGCSWVVLGRSEAFWDALEWSGTLWGSLGRLGALWDPLGRYGTRGALVCSGALWDAL